MVLSMVPFPIWLSTVGPRLSTPPRPWTFFAILLHLSDKSKSRPRYVARMKTLFSGDLPGAMNLRFIGSAARSTLSVAALVVGLFGAATASEASDPIGIYGLVDRVVFEPGPDNAERVQVWGVFSVAVKDSRDAYAAPKAGYLYYTVKPGEESKCRKEWADFSSVAGKRQCIGFGSRRGENGKLRDAKE